MKSVSKEEEQLKYIDTKGMRVIKNSEHVAEQIKSNKDKHAVMDEVKFGKVEKLGNSKIDDETCRRSEEKLYRSIMRGLIKRNYEKHAMLAEMEEDQDTVCFDDVTGKELPWSEVRKARELELKYLRDLGVYEKVDEREAIEKYGVNPIDTKWIDTDKAFEGEPMQIRSRKCAREFKSDDRPDLYAGTPPLEALKAIISIAANHKGTFSIMHIDVSRGYFHAKAQRPVLIRHPAEDRMGTDEEKVGLMTKSMYGTRDAASNWERDWQDNVKKWGFQLGLSSKNLSYHKEHQVSGLTHGDDFVLTGPTKRLMEFNKEMKKMYPTKEKIISFGSQESIKTLNMRLHWGNEGIVYQHDPRHVDVLVRELGLENGNTVQTPAAPSAAEEEESEALDQVQNHRYRSQVARCLFLSQDRADITFIVNELCQTVSNPTQLSLAKLKRLTRYLKRERQWGQVFKYEKAVAEVTMFTDSDWAGCKETRKSSSAGVAMSGAHALKAYTRKQKIIARSSAEAELYAAALGASELKGIISLMRDLGQDKKPVLTIDAKATEHILHRQGIGKLKHIDVAYLWIQDEVRSRRLQVRRVKSEDNIADLGTKPLSKAVIAKHCTMMGYVNMRQDEVQMGHQARGCPKALNICAAGDHVQKADGIELQQRERPQQRQQADQETRCIETSRSTITEQDEDERAGWGTSSRTWRSRSSKIASSTRSSTRSAQRTRTWKPESSSSSGWRCGRTSTRSSASH